MKRHPLDKLRMAMQLAFLIGMPLLYIFTDLLKGMHWASCLFVWLVFAANFLFGKLFCSHLCPFGLLSETVFKLKRKWIGEKWEIRRWSLPCNLLRSLKYIFLAALFLPDVPEMSGTLLIAIIVTAIIAGGIFDDMFFCKYLCFANATSNIIRFTVFILVLLAINAITVGRGQVLERPYVYVIGFSDKHYRQAFSESPVLSDEEREEYLDVLKGNVLLAKDMPMKRQKRRKKKAESKEQRAKSRKVRGDKLIRD